MKNYVVLSMLLAGGIAQSALAAIEPVKPLSPVKQANQQKPKRYIVMFQPVSDVLAAASIESTGMPSVFSQNTFSVATARKVIQSSGGKGLRALPSVTSMAAMLTEDQVASLSANQEVALIEEDPVRYLQAEKASWGLGKVQAGQLDDSVISGQKVCVIDTGYSLGHEDLMSGANISGQVLDATGGQASLGEWSTDGYGHGTFISGVISAQENNLGVRGVIPGAAIDIHNVKVIHNPNYWSLWGSDMIAAVAACQQVGATVINMSIGGGNSSEAERQAMDNAAAGGALLFAAAGNRGNSSYFYPASYDGVISVAATDEQDARWNYSHQNDQVELAAPGVNVRSTLPNNSYSNWDGTSVATAFASGVAALVWGQFPECSADQVRSALTRSALDKGAQGKDDEFGHGIIQAKAAYDLLSSEGCGVQQAGIQSCKDILDAGLSTGDGIYSIDLDGEDGPLAAMNVQCDMTRDGGGWTGITPGIAFALNGGVLNEVDGQPTSKGFQGNSPFALLENGSFILHYTVPVHRTISQFYLDGYTIKGASHLVPNGNDYDMGFNLNPLTTWNSLNFSSPNGDLGIGTLNDAGPAMRLSSWGYYVAPEQEIDVTPRFNDVYTFGSPSESFTIAFSEYGGPEGLYAWWSGTIFVR